MSTPRNAFSSNASFTPSALATPNSMDQTPNSNQEQDKSLMPVTVKQLQKYHQGTLYGKNVTKVCLVGKVSDLTKNETNVSFVFEDGTGVCKCTWWASAEDCEFENESYVRIFGKWENSKSCITVFGCQILSTMNELVLHSLDVMYSHHQHTKGGASMGLENKMNFEASNETTNNNQDGEDGSAYSGILYAKNIINVIKTHGDESGAHIDKIISQAGVSDSAQLKQSVQQLVDDGIIYSTVDDEHFNVC